MVNSLSCPKLDGPPLPVLSASLVNSAGIGGPALSSVAASTGAGGFDLVSSVNGMAAFADSPPSDIGGVDPTDHSAGKDNPIKMEVLDELFGHGWTGDEGFGSGFDPGCDMLHAAVPHSPPPPMPTLSTFAPSSMLAAVSCIPQVTLPPLSESCLRGLKAAKAAAAATATVNSSFVATLPPLPTLTPAPMAMPSTSDTPSSSSLSPPMDTTHGNNLRIVIPNHADSSSGGQAVTPGAANGAAVPTASPMSAGSASSSTNKKPVFTAKGEKEEENEND
jgi:hypothetical protein